MSIPLAQLDPPPSLAEPSAKTVRIVVCGEVSSGKTTVLSTLLKGAFMPDFLGDRARPFVLVRHTDGEAENFIQLADGSIKSLASPGGSEIPDEMALCSIATKLPHLRGMDILEIPYMSEASMTEEKVALVAAADILVWTTIASQAWRLSEKSILDQIGERRPKRSILVVSRCDNLRSDDTRERLLERLQRETGDYFSDIVMLNGSKKLLKASETSDDIWASMSGARLNDRIQAHAQELRKQASEKTTVPGNKGAEIVHLPRAAMAATPAPVSTGQTERATGVSEQVVASLQEIANSMHGIMALGFVSLVHPDSFDQIVGSRDRWSGLGSYCHSTLTVLAAQDGKDVSSLDAGSQVSAGRKQVMFHSYPKRSVALAMVSETKLMNPSLARTCFARLSRSFESTADLS